MMDFILQCAAPNTISEKYLDVQTSFLPEDI